MLPAALRLPGLRPSRAVAPRDAAASGSTEICQRAVEAMRQGLCILDASDRILFANARFAEIQGLETARAAVGKTWRAILERQVPKRTTPSAGEPARPYTVPRRDQSWDERLADGRKVRIVTASMAGGGWIATFEELSDDGSTHGGVSAGASDVDALTRLPDRTAFTKRLREAMQQALRGHGLALFWINVDQFRCINSHYGVSSGDDVLREIAGRLRAIARPGDWVARLGGDEFAFVLAGINEPSKVADTARAIMNELNKPFMVADQRIIVSVSIGVSLAPADALTAEDLERNADTAIGFARKCGGKTYRFFQPDMDVAMRSRQRLEAQLQEALAKGSFEAAYQPIVDLATGRVATIEALVRWRTEDGNLVRPDSFLTLAEETGLIRPIGAWMLERACTDARSWSDDIRVAVNFSMAQFRGGRLSDEIAATLAGTGLPASRLEIEVTESVLLDDDPGILRELLALKEMGVSFAMDDFGTGYSSLATLAKFPFDKIKIDRAFVSALGKDRTSPAILRSICSLALDLGAVTVAEGVETRDQLEFVRQEGCSEVQGYFFSPPTSSANLDAAIHACGERAQFHMAG